MTVTATATTSARPIKIEHAEGGSWVVTCTEHNWTHRLATRAAARTLASQGTAAFCGICAGHLIATPAESPDEPVEPPAEMPTPAAVPTPEVPAEPQTDIERVRAATVASKPKPAPSLGAYKELSSSVVHLATDIVEHYMHTVCDQVILRGAESSAVDPQMCVYCLTGVAAPKPGEVRRPKARKVKAEGPEAQYSDLTDAVQQATNALIEALKTDTNVTDARRGVAILAQALDSIKAIAPRRPVGTITGARSGLVKQSASIRPSRELIEMRECAEAGDERAKEIMKHVAAYQPDHDCSYCWDRYGKATRHGYATAFMSVGLELRAARARLAARNQTSVAS